jgi:hypothetical protein
MPPRLEVYSLGYGLARSAGGTSRSRPLDVFDGEGGHVELIDERAAEHGAGCATGNG